MSDRQTEISLLKTTPSANPAARAKRIAEIEAMTDEQFQRHQAARRATVSRLAAGLLKGGR